MLMPPPFARPFRLKLSPFTLSFRPLEVEVNQ